MRFDLPLLVARLSLSSTFLLSAVVGAPFTGCSNTQSTTEASKPQTVEERADELVLKAWSHESKVTPLLQEITAEMRAQLYGLEHRLKTRSSTILKINRVIKENPSLQPAQVIINDMLRYTLLVNDKPAGHYKETLGITLKRLEAIGNKVLRVKNYWPKGDNYSGVNCDLETAAGMRWELQFHTLASLRQNRINRPLYERLRRPNLSLPEQQRTFDRMTRPWEEIPIPEGLLTVEGLHERTELVQRGRPGKEPQTPTEREDPGSGDPDQP